MDILDTIDNTADTRVIPIQPVAKVSARQKTHLEKARKNKKIKNVIKKVESLVDLEHEKKMIDTVRPLINSIVTDDPYSAIDDIFYKVSDQLKTPASEPFIQDNGEYEAEEVKPVQNNISRVIESVATPETINHIEKQATRQLSVNPVIETYSNNPVIPQGIIFL